MLEMKPLQEKALVKELFGKAALPWGEDCGAFCVWDRGERCGSVLFSLGGTMKILLVDCSDPFLLDGLVRGAIHHGSLAGAQGADFSGLDESGRRELEPLGFLQKEPLPIEWFLENCKPCRGGF